MKQNARSSLKLSSNSSKSQKQPKLMRNKRRMTHHTCLPHSPIQTCKRVSIWPSQNCKEKGINTDDSLFLTNQADDTLDFLNRRELPQDVHNQMKARKDKLTVQTNLLINITLKIDSNGEVKQREWNFILFPPASEKICISRSHFKLDLRPCPKGQQKTWTTQFPTMEKQDVQHWCHFHTLLEDHCSIHGAHVLPIDEMKMCDDP